MTDSPALTPTRAHLSAVLAEHGEVYDSDCGYYSGCACGWDNGTVDHNDGYEDHVADALISSRAVLAADELAGDGMARVRSLDGVATDLRESVGADDWFAIPERTRLRIVQHLAAHLGAKP